MSVACLLMLACSAERAPDRASVERDSAGIRIVENADVADTTRRIRLATAAPRVAIGERDGDPAYTFGRIGGAARLADGRIVVVDEMAAEVRFYDAAGRHLRSVGRAGDGPGDFREPRLLRRLPGDTLLVTDQNDFRLTTLSPDGEVLGRVDLTSNREVPDRIVGRFADGTLLARGTWSSSPEEQPGVTRVDADWLRISADGSARDSIGRHFDFYRPMVATGNSRFYITRPFERDLVFATDDSGFWLGDPERWELRRHDVAGTLRRIVRLGRAPVIIESAELERARERFVGRMSPRVRPALRELPLPATYPPYAELRLDAAGRLWVREYASSSDEHWPDPDAEPVPTRWLVHDAGGRLLATVVLPPRAAVLEIGADHLLLSVRDDSDVEQLQLHDLPDLAAVEPR